MALLLSVTLCVLIQPSVVFTSRQGGVSNYGTTIPTLFVFSAGVWVCAVLLLIAAARIKSRSLRRLLKILATWYILLAVSTYPYKLNQVFENIHIAVAFGLAFYQLGLIVWLAGLNKFDRFSRLCLGVTVISLFIGVLTIFQIVDQLFTSQIVSAIGFGALLVHSVRNH